MIFTSNKIFLIPFFYFLPRNIYDKHIQKQSVMSSTFPYFNFSNPIKSCHNVNTDLARPTVKFFLSLYFVNFSDVKVFVLYAAL